MLFSGGMAHASSGEINVTGNIVSNTCSVSLEDRDKTVKMGTVSSKAFLHGMMASPPTVFTLNLIDCGPAASAVSVVFQGTEDANRHDLLALDSGDTAAGGVGIAILDNNKTPLPINTSSSDYVIPPDAGRITLNFYAQYLANGATVSAGAANATATFSLIYE